MTSIKNLLFVCFFAGIVSGMLGGCSNFRDTLGLDKDPPDEFAVITRAPLAMPPTMVLPPPTPGKARPQEVAVVDQAKEAFFGQSEKLKDTPVLRTAAESALLQKAGAAQAHPDIRQLVNKETKELADRNRPVVEKLISITGESLPSASVVDPEAEYQRIKSAREKGETVTGDGSALIEQ